MPKPKRSPNCTKRWDAHVNFASRPPPRYAPFNYSLLKDGVAYLNSAVANGIISHYGRGRKNRRESRLRENSAFEGCSDLAQRSAARDLAPLISQLWDRFWALCGDGKTNETARALMESARLFPHGESAEAQFLFFHSRLEGDRLSGCPDPQWVRAHLQLLLGLNDDALNQRKFRLKQPWGPCGWRF